MLVCEILRHFLILIYRRWELAQPTPFLNGEMYQVPSPAKKGNEIENIVVLN